MECLNEQATEGNKDKDANITRGPVTSIWVATMPLVPLPCKCPSRKVRTRKVQTRKVRTRKVQTLKAYLHP